MKTLFSHPAALCAFFLLPLSVAPVASAAPSDQPIVNVTAKPDGEVLAKGFADAFDTLPNTPVFITYERRDKGFVTLSGIRSVRAYGGVLAIRTDRGPTLVVPATAIVSITDERPAGI